jgi:hypothetical protein
VPIADSGVPIRGKSGQMHGTVLVFRDVTESNRAEAALKAKFERLNAPAQLPGVVGTVSQVVEVLGR